MSRQRISPPVKDGIFDECTHCMGSGLVRSINSIVLLVFRRIQELIAQGRVKVISIEISSEVATYLLSNKFDALAELKDKYQVEFKFNSKPGITFENFKFDILESKEDEESKSLDKNIEKEGSNENTFDSKLSVKTDKPKILEPEKGSTQTKRRYQRRKPVSRRGETRGRGRKPYSSRKRPNDETSPVNTEEQSPDSIKKHEFNQLPEIVDSSIIPLPAPYIRPKAESDSSIPDENVSEG
tara:strand:- start:219 stop:938 length:720 start_codon:yes stop_codon:yes gene_type:complete